jgi:hypothetical protein
LPRVFDIPNFLLASLTFPHPLPYPSSNAKTVLGCAGYHGDVITLIKRIEHRMTMYEHAHHKPMR